MRRLSLALALCGAVIASTASGQDVPSATYKVNLPATCNNTTPSTKCVLATPVVNPDGTNIGGGGAATNPSQGSSATATTGPMVQGRVISGEQSYTVDTVQPLNLTTTGRLKVGTSYSGNITPAATPSTNTTSAIAGCQYRASPVTWQDTWTGSLRCSNSGQLAVNVEASALPTGAATSANQPVATVGAATPSIVVPIAGRDGSSNSRVLLTDSNGAIVVGSANIQGNTASGTTDGGAPVKIGGVYNSTAPTYTTGQRGDLSIGSRGSLWVQLMDSNTSTPQRMVGDNADGVGVSSTGQNISAVVRNTVFNGTSYDRMRGDTTGTYVVAKGPANLATGQVSVGTTATLLAAARTGRHSISLIVGAANSCAIGNSGVTLTTGYLLPSVAGATDTTATSAALYAICSATTTISFKEIY